MRYEVPEPWASALIEAGFTDPRNDQRPSWRRLAEATDIHVSTLTAMAEGRRGTRQDVIDKVSEHLRVPARVVNEWVGRVRTESQPYRPPDVANLLSREERKAVDNLILLLARSKMKGLDEDGT